MNHTPFEFRNVSKSYGVEDTKEHALQDIDLKLKRGSLNLILGPSGSGKSSLINLASLMDSPTQGKIFIKGKDTSKMDISERSKFRRRKIGIIYQRENLFSFLNLIENLETPMLVKDHEKAKLALNNVGINEIEKFPKEISELDRQKVTLSRALINDPGIILADEPTGELNSSQTHTFMKLFKELGKNHTILMVSNDPNLNKFSDNTFHLKDGFLILK